MKKMPEPARSLGMMVIARFVEMVHAWGMGDEPTAVEAIETLRSVGVTVDLDQLTDAAKIFATTQPEAHRHG